MSNSDSRQGSNPSSSDTPSAAPPETNGTSRRDFIKIGGTVVAAISLPEFLASCGVSPAPHAEALGSATGAATVASIDINPIPNTWFPVVRPADMLRVDMNLVGFNVTGTGASKVMTPSSSTTPGLIIIRFPAQHMEELTVSQPATGNPTTVPPPPIATQMAGASQVVFQVPPGTSVPYDLAGLLTAVSNLNLNVAANAYPAGDDALPAIPKNTATTDPDQTLGALQTLLTSRATSDAGSDLPPPFDVDPSTHIPLTGTVAPALPDDSMTKLELPYQLVISPSANLRFAHSPNPYAPNGSTFTELWTSRLARAAAAGGADDSARVPVSARAIWSIAAPADPFTNPTPTLSSTIRAKLVTQTSDRTKVVTGQVSGTTPAPTRPFHARRLMLSSRGGSLDTSGLFLDGSLGTPGNGNAPLTDLLSWKQRTSYGRDNYIRVETAGILFPWLHFASLVTISERKFLANPNSGGGARTAYLWQQQFLVIQQPVIQYTPSTTADWPFTQMRILTPSTPPLDTAPSAGTVPFFPSINGTAFRFAAQFIDLDQNVTQSEVTAIFLPQSNGNNTTIQAIQTQFASADPDGSLRNQAEFRRQRIAYALPKSNTTGTTSYETTTVTFSGKIVTVELSALTPFVVQTKVNLPSTRQFTGNDDALTLQYPTNYVQNGGFSSANPGEVFLELAANGAAKVDFGAQTQRGGGFVAPSMGVIGLSRASGPIAGTAANVAAASAQLSAFDTTNNADPANLFADALSSAKIFGVFTLKDLFGGTVPSTNLLSASSLPKFGTQFLDVVGSSVRTIGQVQSVLTSLQSQVTTLASTFTTQLTQLGTDLGTLLGVISTLPPSSTYAHDAGTALTAISNDLKALAITVGTARSSNAALAVASRASDAYFAQAIAALNNASTMVGSPDLQKGLTALQTASQAALNMTSHFEWQTTPGAGPTYGDIKPVGIPGVAPNIFVPSATTVLKLTGEARAHDVAGKPAGIDITAGLNNFDINLIGTSAEFLTLKFNRLVFAMLAGQKPNIDVSFGGITFQGPLYFLNALKSIIPLNGFSDPPGITVDAQGIQGEFSIALPALSVGVFTLENVNLGASFKVPFVGEPLTVGFHFSERQSPFHLTVALLGGGGYFLMDLSLQGVVLLEASLEFGAEASINLVVASGTVLVMAGIYFRYAPAGTPAGVTLSGYVRIAGSLSVLGLITASVEMRLDLGYQEDDSVTPHKAYAFGKATISVEISILFFSESVDIHCEKKFAACNADPTFADVMGPALVGPPAQGPTPWQEYVQAFAA